MEGAYQVRDKFNELGAKQWKKKLLYQPVSRRNFVKSWTNWKCVSWVSNNGNNLVYVLVNFSILANVVREIGRLRRTYIWAAVWTCAMALDLVMDNEYCEKLLWSMITWSPEDEEMCARISSHQLLKTYTEMVTENLSTTTSFWTFSAVCCCRLRAIYDRIGGSFCATKISTAIDNRKGIFQLNKLWMDLSGGFGLNNLKLILFGKVTMYPH